MKIQYAANNIHIFESALYRTTSTVIALKHSVIIIDPNWLPQEVEFIRSFVEKNYPDHKIILIFTHSDYDHIIGYNAFKNAKTIASRAFEENTHKDTVIKQIIDFDNTWYLKRQYPISYPKIDFVIENDNTQFNIEDVTFHFYHAPGHVADAIFIIIPKLNIWIAGDYLSNIEIPIIDDIQSDYVSTIEKSTYLLNNYKTIELLVTGHGDVAHNRKEISKRIAEDKQYLDLVIQNKEKNNTAELIAFIKNRNENPKMIDVHNNNIIRIKNQLT